MDRLYTCPACGKNHKTHVDTASGLDTKHYRVVSYKCSVCGSGYEEIETGTHTKNYTPVSSTVHLVKCNLCLKQSGNGFGNEAHSFTYTDNHNGYITKKCTKCGYSEDNPIDYTINLDGNLGTCSVTTKAMKYDGSYTLPSCTRTGYVLRGWQVYSGSTLYTNCTDTTGATTAKVIPAGSTVSKLTTNDGSTVKLVAVWKKLSATVSYTPITLTGNVIKTYSDTDKDIYIAKAGSSYKPDFGLTYKGLPYYRLTSVTLKVDGIPKPSGYSRTDDTPAGDYDKNTVVTKNLTINGSDSTKMTAEFGYADTYDWYDAYNAKNTTNGGKSSKAEIYFDGKAPLPVSSSLDEMDALHTETGDYSQLIGKTISIKATDDFGGYYAGLGEGSYIKIYNPKNNLTKTLTKTATTTTDATFGTRIKEYTFESFTIGSTGVFEEGFDLTIHLVDRLGNAYDYSKSFGAFNISITDIGSYTYDRPGTSFVNGEAVYVRVKTTGSVEKYDFELTPSTEVETYGSSGVSYDTLKHTVTSDMLTKTSKLTMPLTGSTNEAYVIFVLPLNGTRASYTVKVTAYKEGHTKSDTKAITVDTTKEVIKPIITIIE